MVNTAEREKEKGKPTQSAKKKSLGQTLVPPCKVTARRLIFKQVLKLQILIGAADSTELFHQIFFVVKGGHLSIFFPNYSSEFTRSGRDVDGELRCRCGFGEPVVNSCIGEQQKVKRTRFLFSSPRLFSYGGGSIYTLNTNSLCSSPRVRSRLLSMLMRQTTKSASAVWT